jgi:uncharacterized membrane protein YkvA (DUF1232 family)
LDTFTLIAIVACLSYIVSPVDLIPDILPIIGFGDDIAVAVFTCKILKNQIDKFKVWRKTNNIESRSFFRILNDLLAVLFEIFTEK